MDSLAADVVALLATQFPNGNVSNASSRAKSLAKVIENLLLNEVLDVDEEEIVEHDEVALKMLNDLLLEWTEEKMSAGISIHDYHLRQQALKINNEHKCLEKFKASHSWIQSFKKRNGFNSRKITKIVSRKVFLKADKVDEDAAKCVDRVKEIIRKEKLPLTAVFNGDQSGFLKEMHGARTLACKGDKSVLRVVDTSHVQVNDIDFPVHKRNNLFKMVSQLAQGWVYFQARPFPNPL